MKQKKPNKHDKCVLCGEITEYAEMDHILVRDFHVDGTGQLCQVCFDKEHNYKQQNAK